MTTPEPRVRVLYDETEAQFIGQCGACHKTLQRRRIFLSGALRDAHRHAAECPAFRLAALLRELEALRGALLGSAANAICDYPDSEYSTGVSHAFKVAAADLTALIDRATDGGTGC